VPPPGYIPSSSVFKWPECSSVPAYLDITDPYGNGAIAPTDMVNNGGFYVNGQGITPYNGLLPFRYSPAFAVACWYALNERVYWGDDMAWPNATHGESTGIDSAGDTNSPFISAVAAGQPNSRGTGIGSPPFTSVAQGVTSPDFTRTIGMITHPSNMVMMVEANTFNWMDQTPSTKYPSVEVVQLAGRHGQKTADGANAYTNLAFFDGHVALYPTEPFVTVPPNQPNGLTYYGLAYVPIPDVHFFMRDDR